MGKTGGNIRGEWTIRKCQNRLRKINPERIELIEMELDLKLTPVQAARLRELQAEAEELLGFMDEVLLGPTRERIEQAFAQLDEAGL